MEYLNIINETDQPLQRAHFDDAGLDLRSSEDVIIEPGSRRLVSTGIKVKIDTGYAGFVVPRSGMALRGLTVANSPGIIDSSYRGEVKIISWNTTGLPFSIAKGDRIAQLLVVPVALPTTVNVMELDETTRGEAGFGSSGVQ